MIFFEDLLTSELEDASYTVSLDLPTQMWTSFHDWIPDFLFSNRNQLFSILGTKLYLNNDAEIGYFYENHYASSITPVLVSPKETLDQKEAFLLNRIAVGGSLPTKSWIFNQYQTSSYTNWIPRDDSLSLTDNYGTANCYFDDGHWQFNYFKNNRLLDNFLYNKRDKLSLNTSSVQIRTTTNYILGDHLVVQLSFGNTSWYFTDIGFNVSWNS